MTTKEIILFRRGPVVSLSAALFLLSIAVLFGSVATTALQASRPHPHLEENEYDVIVLGTGPKECILSGLLSVSGKKVLHLDQNRYYGGDSASLNIHDLWTKFKGKGVEPPPELGRYRDWHIDPVPKFLMKNGLLMKMILHTGLNEYLEWENVDDAYVYQFQEASLFSSKKLIHKVPAASGAEWGSSLIGRITHYIDGAAPFIYPIHGLGGLLTGFSLLSTTHGGTYMLNKLVDGPEYGPDGKVVGVRSGDEVKKAKLVISDPLHAPDNKIKIVGSVIRAICILGAPIPNTDEAQSAQIILTAKEMKRQNDIYITMVSHAHQVAKAGKYIATVSTKLEKEGEMQPVEEIRPALELLGKIEHRFFTVSALFEPTDNGQEDGVHVFSSPDAISSTPYATSHFESTAADVMAMWRQIFGEDLVLSAGLRDGDSF